MVSKEDHAYRQFYSPKKKPDQGSIAAIIGTDDTLKPLADNARIPFYIVNNTDQVEAESHILRLIELHNVDLIILARYMRILTPNFVWRYPNRIINIHPSLLPAFPGAYAYIQAYERGAKIVGLTAHFCN